MSLKPCMCVPCEPKLPKFGSFCAQRPFVCTAYTVVIMYEAPHSCMKTLALHTCNKNAWTWNNWQLVLPPVLVQKSTDFVARYIYTVTYIAMFLLRKHATPRPNGISRCSYINLWTLTFVYTRTQSPMSHCSYTLATNLGYNWVIATLHQLSNGTMNGYTRIWPGYTMQLLLLLADQQSRLPYFSHFQFISQFSSYVLLG